MQQEKCFGWEPHTLVSRERQRKGVKKTKRRSAHQRASGVQRLAEGLAGRETLIQLDELCVGSLESWRVKEDKDISGVHSVYLSPSLRRAMFS